MDVFAYLDVCRLPVHWSSNNLYSSWVCEGLLFLGVYHQCSQWYAEIHQHEKDLALFCLFQALIDGNLMKLPTFAVKACVTQCTTGPTVDLSRPKNVSSIMWRNKCNAKYIKVINTCISTEMAWFLFVSGRMLSATSPMM